MTEHCKQKHHAGHCFVHSSTRRRSCGKAPSSSYPSATSASHWARHRCPAILLLLKVAVVHNERLFDRLAQTSVTISLHLFVYSNTDNPSEPPAPMVVPWSGSVRCSVFQTRTIKSLALFLRCGCWPAGAGLPMTPHSRKQLPLRILSVWQYLQL